MPKIFPVVVRRVTGSAPPAGDQDVFFVDSVGFSDEVSGTFGPIFAADSFDLGDVPILGPFSVVETVDLGDAPSTWELDVTAAETLDLGDAAQVGLLDADAAESLDLSDAIGAGTDLDVAESIDLSDQPAGWAFNVVAADSLDIGDAGAQRRITVVDTIDFGDLILPALGQPWGVSRLVVADSIDIGDAHAIQDLTAEGYGTAAPVSGSVNDVANVLGNNGGNFATSTVASSGATNNQSNPVSWDLQVVLANPFASGGVLPTIDYVEVIMFWSFTTGGLLGASGRDYNLDMKWSLNDGGSFTTYRNRAATVNALGAGNTEQTEASVITADVGNDWAKLRDLRLQFVGTANSGTGGVGNQVSITMRWHRVRVQWTASKP